MMVLHYRRSVQLTCNYTDKRHVWRKKVLYCSIPCNGQFSVFFPLLRSLRKVNLLLILRLPFEATAQRKAGDTTGDTPGDRRKSPGVPGAAISIFADRRDRCIKSPISSMSDIGD